MTRQTYYDDSGSGETTFTVSASSIKFGAGCLRELGQDAALLGMKRVAFFVDANVLATEPARVALKSLAGAGLDAVVYDDAHVEPTDTSFADATDFARDGKFDGFVSLGGGSVMDTAKAANLFSTYPDDLLAYVNAPIGRAKPVPGPVKPHIACPTTSGTGSETTGVTIFDFVERNVKTGISSKWLKPTMAVVDPTTTHTLPAGIVAATGFDVFTHAIEFLHRRALYRPRPARVARRPAALPGRQSIQRHRQHARDPAWRALSEPRGQRRRRPRSPPCADVRRHPRGSVLRQRRCPHSPRHVLRRGRPQPYVPRPGIREGRSHGSARDLGGGQRAGRVPLHRRGRAGTPPRRRQRPWGRIPPAPLRKTPATFSPGA